MIDLRCPVCGQLLAKSFEGQSISLKCHRHPQGGIVSNFTLSEGKLAVSSRGLTEIPPYVISKTAE